MLIVACLSQKGGVGKSTLARLIARTYAAEKWRVKIADFNVKQKTSVDWSATRMAQQIEPEVPAEAFSDPGRIVNLSNQNLFDLVVLDGKPDADTQTIRLATSADLIIIPTGVSADDLSPQIRFAQELIARGVDRARILFVLNKSTDSAAATEDARKFIQHASFDVAKHDLGVKTGYLNAQNTGRALTETTHGSLNARARRVAQEIVDRLTKLTGEAA